jgi:hypothetical protein
MVITGFISPTGATNEPRSMWVESDLVVRLRIADEPVPETAEPTEMLVRADFSAISYKVYREVDGVDALVEGYENVSVTIEDAILAGDAIREWGKDGVGYNFRHVVPAEAFAANAAHRVVYRFLCSGVTTQHCVTVHVQGPTGDTASAGTGTVTGEPGEPGADGQGLVWRGEWGELVSYSELDVVVNGDAVYIATADNTGDEPPGASWDLMISGGVQGVDGEPGVSSQFVQVASKTVSNTLTETTLINSTGALGALDIPANEFLAGNKEVIEAGGVFSTADTGPVAIQVRVYLGSEIVAEFPSVGLNGSQASVPWFCELHLTRRSSGGAGVVWGRGLLAIGGASGTRMFAIAVAPTTLASNDIKTPDVTAEWSETGADNSFVCYGVNVIQVGSPS